MAADLFSTDEDRAREAAERRLEIAGWKPSPALPGYWWSPDCKRCLPWRDALAELDRQEQPSPEAPCGEAP